MSITTKIRTNPEKVAQLRSVLGGRFSQKVWMYTLAGDGTLTLHGCMNGILHDVVRTLEAEGYLA